MSRYRNWCFTLNFGELPPFLFLDGDFNDSLITYLCYQEEVGDSGTHHLQGYLELSAPRPLRSVLAFPLFCDLQQAGYSFHLEPRRGTQAEAIAYCRKPDSAIAGSFQEFGAFIPRFRSF